MNVASVVCLCDGTRLWNYRGVFREREEASSRVFEMLFEKFVLLASKKIMQSRFAVKQGVEKAGAAFNKTTVSEI